MTQWVLLSVIALLAYHIYNQILSASDSIAFLKEFLVYSTVLTVAFVLLSFTFGNLALIVKTYPSQIRLLSRSTEMRIHAAAKIFAIAGTLIAVQVLISIFLLEPPRWVTWCVSIVSLFLIWRVIGINWRIWERRRELKSIQSLSPDFTLLLELNAIVRTRRRIASLLVDLISVALLVAVAVEMGSQMTIEYSRVIAPLLGMSAAGVFAVYQLYIDRVERGVARQLRNMKADLILNRVSDEIGSTFVLNLHIGPTVYEFLTNGMKTLWDFASNLFPLLESCESEAEKVLASSSSSDEDAFSAFTSLAEAIQDFSSLFRTLLLQYRFHLGFIQVLSEQKNATFVEAKLATHLDVSLEYWVNKLADHQEEGRRLLKQLEGRIEWGEATQA